MRAIKFCSRGFTLIEILLTISLIAILAAIVIVAINPGRQFETVRDTERKTDLLTIMNGVYQYATDNSGAFPSTITTDELEICKTGAEDCTDLVDLSVLTDNSLYLIELPIDPACADEEVGECDESGTGYYINLTDNGRIYIYANGEDDIIEITR